tara:strand:+ start:2399 stop:2743 length:345 start_codon:yes stop_codon:yes gene_type:complete
MVIIVNRKFQVGKYYKLYGVPHLVLSMSDKTIRFRSMNRHSEEFRKKLRVHHFSSYIFGEAHPRTGHYILYSSTTGGPFTTKIIKAGDWLSPYEVDYWTDFYLKEECDGSGILG